MLSLIYKNNLLKTAIFDIISVTLILFVPTLSHITGFPFYVFEPMRLLIIPYLLFSKNKNAYLLAIVMPLFSYLIAGHPSLYKMPLVAIDLLVNIAIFSFLIKKQTSIYISLVISVVASKLTYYTLKALFIYVGIYGNGLIETNFIYQIINMILILAIALIFKNKIKDKL